MQSLSCCRRGPGDSARRRLAPAFPQSTSSCFAELVSCGPLPLLLSADGQAPGPLATKASATCQSVTFGLVQLPVCNFSTDRERFWAFRAGELTEERRRREKKRRAEKGVPISTVLTKPTVSTKPAIQRLCETAGRERLVLLESEADLHVVVVAGEAADSSGGLVLLADVSKGGLHE